MGNKINLTKKSTPYLNWKVHFDKTPQSESESKNDPEILMTKKSSDVNLHTKFFWQILFALEAKSSSAFEPWSIFTHRHFHTFQGTFNSELSKSHQEKRFEILENRKQKYYTSKEVKMEKCIFFCMTTKHWFNIKCNIMSNEFSCDGFILWNDF